MKGAKVLLEAYEHTRGVGHTRVAVEAAEEHDAILVVHTTAHGEQLAKAGAQCEIAPVWHLTQSVWGKRKPLVVDNAVVIELAKDLVHSQAQLEVGYARQERLMLRNAQLEREAFAVRERSALLARYPRWWKWIGRQLIKLLGR